MIPRSVTRSLARVLELRAAPRQPLNPLNPTHENAAGYRDCLLALLKPLSAAAKSVIGRALPVRERRGGGAEAINGRFLST